MEMAGTKPNPECLAQIVTAKMAYSTCSTIPGSTIPFRHSQLIPPAGYSSCPIPR